MLGFFNVSQSYLSIVFGGVVGGWILDLILTINKNKSTLNGNHQKKIDMDEKLVKSNKLAAKFTELEIIKKSLKSENRFISYINIYFYALFSYFVFSIILFMFIFLISKNIYLLYLILGFIGIYIMLLSAFYFINSRSIKNYAPKSIKLLYNSINSLKYPDKVWNEYKKYFLRNNSVGFTKQYVFKKREFFRSKALFINLIKREIQSAKLFQDHKNSMKIIGLFKNGLKEMYFSNKDVAKYFKLHNEISNIAKNDPLLNEYNVKIYDKFSFNLKFKQFIIPLIVSVISAIIVRIVFV